MSGGADTEERFERAAEHMRTNTSLQLNNEQKLQLYGYFKQAKEGVCSSPKPGFFDFTGRAKWEAWHKLGNMPQLEAMQQYVATVSVLVPDWETVEPEQSAAATHGEGGGGRRGAGGGGTGGPVVSKMADTEETILDKEKTIFDWCKEGREDKLETLVSQENINTRDDQGMALLHWACDRGHLDIVKLLTRRGADINIQDADQQTALHYATSCDQHEVVSFLLSAGIDPTIRDCDGNTAEEVAGEQSTRNLFKQT